MSTHDDLREALRAEAGRYDPADDGWDGISAGVRAARARRRRLQGAVLGAAAAVVVVGVGLGFATLDNGTDVDAGPLAGDAPTTTTTTTTPSTTTTTTTAPSTSTTEAPLTGPTEAGLFPGIWPFTSQEAVDRYEDGDARLEDPVQTAGAFARDYLGMLDPAVGEAVASGDGSTAVELRAKGEDGEPVPEGGPTTVVTLRPYETSGGSPVWTVVDARSPNIVVDQPAAAAGASSPLIVRGRATGYEGTVIAQLRQDGMRAGESLADAVGIAGTYGELADFTLELAWTAAPTEPAGAVIVSTDTGLDGVGTPEATVVRVRFTSPPGEARGGATCEPAPPPGAPAEGEMEVRVWYTCAERIAGGESEGPAFVRVVRRVPQTRGVLRATLEQLLRGPTRDEELAGLSSLFGTEPGDLQEDTTDLLRGVTVADGTAVVDLARTVGNASTSAGSVSFLGELNRTVLGVPTVAAVEYRLQGSCEAFGEWLQRSGCLRFTDDDL